MPLNMPDEDDGDDARGASIGMPPKRPLMKAPPYMMEFERRLKKRPVIVDTPTVDNMPVNMPDEDDGDDDRGASIGMPPKRPLMKAPTYMMEFGRPLNKTLRPWRSTATVKTPTVETLTVETPTVPTPAIALLSPAGLYEEASQLQRYCQESQVLRVQKIHLLGYYPASAHAVKRYCQAWGVVRSILVAQKSALIRPSDCLVIMDYAAHVRAILQQGREQLVDGAYLVFNSLETAGSCSEVVLRPSDDAASSQIPKKHRK